MSERTQNLAVALFGELLALDQLSRASVTRAMPKGMELSHFMVLNHLAQSGDEKSPGQLASSFHVTRGAMTNTLNKLEWAGWIHVRPDWDDARRKMVAISPAGRAARTAAIAGIGPVIEDVVAQVGEDRVRSAMPVLRDLRTKMSDPKT